MFSRRFYMVCLITGMLALGEVGVQAMPASDVMNRTDGVQAQADEEIRTEDLFEIEYQNLEEKEADCRERLQEKEAELKDGGDVSQTEIMDLNEELRSIQLQKIVLESRMEK